MRILYQPSRQLVLILGGSYLISSASAQILAPFVPSDTYHSCAFPKFEWATASAHSGGSMEAHQLEIIGDTIFSAGSIWSFDDPTSDSYKPTDDDLKLKGPFTALDPTSATGITLNHDVEAYPERRPYDCSVTMIDKNTGTPKKIVSLVGPGACYVYTMAKGSDAIAVGGENGIGGSMSAITKMCTTVIGADDGSSTSCSDGKTTIVAPTSAYAAHVFSMDTEGNFNWLVQPWLELSPDLKAQNNIYTELAVIGSAVDSDGDVYIIGHRVSTDGTADGENIFSAMLSKHSSVDGSVIWEKEFAEAKYGMSLAYDASEDVIFATFLVPASDPDAPGELGITCVPTNEDVTGCNALVRLSAEDGSVQWARYAYGDNRRPWNLGDVHLAHPKDGPYVYAAFVKVGASSLDLGSSYAVCKDVNGTVVPEFSPPLNTLASRLTQDDCTSLGLGSYFGSDSEFAIPANAASSGAFCADYGGWYKTCMVKYNKVTGMPIWGSIEPPITAFRPQSDGVVMTGDRVADTPFDLVKVARPLGAVDGYNMIFQSKMSLDGDGLYVQPIIADRSYVYEAGLTDDPETEEVYLGFVTTTDLTYLGPGAPGGFTMDLQLDTCEGDAEICEGGIGMVVAKIGEDTTPHCIETCAESTGEHVIKDGMCFIEQVCYSDGESGARIGMPCLQCNAAASQREWSAYNLVGTEFCYIGGACLRAGAPLAVKVGRWETLDSKCQVCDPAADKNGYSGSSEFIVDSTQDPPNDCLAITSIPSDSPTEVPTSSPTEVPTSSPSEKSKEPLTASPSASPSSIVGADTSTAATTNFRNGVMIGFIVLTFSL